MLAIFLLAVTSNILTLCCLLNCLRNTKKFNTMKNSKQNTIQQTHCGCCPKSKVIYPVCKQLNIHKRIQDIILLQTAQCQVLGATTTKPPHLFHSTYIIYTFDFGKYLPTFPPPFPGLVGHLHMVTPSFSCTLHAPGLGSSLRGFSHLRV